MKFITFAFFLTFTHLLAFDIILVPYVEKSSYKNDYKSSSKVEGIYTKVLDKDYSLELNYEKMDLDYTSISQLKQTDYTIAYSLYFTNYYRLKTAYHKISGNSNKNPNATIYFLGLQYLKKNSYDIGIDFANSSYDSSILVNDLHQMTTYARITFGEYKSLMGKYTIKFDNTLIYPQNLALDSIFDKKYSSYGVALKQYKGDFINSIGGFKGKEIFSVKDNAFNVHNLNELYTSSYYISTKYKVSEYTGFTLSYKSENFTDFETNKDDTTQKYLFSLDYTIR